MTRLVRPSLLSVLILCVGGCLKHEKPSFVYMPDMAYSPAVKAQEEGSMKPPVAGTVKRGQENYPFPNDIEAAGRNLSNPLKRTKAVLNKGKELFNIYCMVCHGPYGEGDGTIVPKFPRPPSLQSDKIRGYTDGKIYHVITSGQNLMPTYARQILPEDRWAVVHYIRVLHRAKNPTAEDLKKLKNW